MRVGVSVILTKIDDPDW